MRGIFPGGRALGALCAEKPFLTSAIMELRVPQVRRLPVCISRVDTTHKRLSHREALGPPRPLIFERAICATHAHSPSARSIGFCVIWVCISSSSSSTGDHPVLTRGTSKLACSWRYKNGNLFVPVASGGKIIIMDSDEHPENSSDDDADSDVPEEGLMNQIDLEVGLLGNEHPRLLWPPARQL